MRQSRLFPPVLVSFITTVFVSLSHLSAAVASWDDIYSPGNCYYDSLVHWGDYPVVPTSGLDQFSTCKILWTNDSVKLLNNPDENYGQEHSRDIVINETFYAMPDELLTMQINSQPSIFDRPSELDGDMQSSSELADDVVFKNNGDYIKSIRIPAPTSMLLVALGLISLRYTRSLRL